MLLAEIAKCLDGLEQGNEAILARFRCKQWSRMGARGTRAPISATPALKSARGTRLDGDYSLGLVVRLIKVSVLILYTPPNLIDLGLSRTRLSIRPIYDQILVTLTHALQVHLCMLSSQPFTSVISH